MFATRGAAEYVSQKESAQHQNKHHFDLILVVGGQSVPSMYVCTLLYSTFEEGMGFPPIYSTKRYQPSFPFGIDVSCLKRYRTIVLLARLTKVRR